VVSLSAVLVAMALDNRTLAKQVRTHATILIPVTPDGAYLRPVSVPPTYVSSDVSPAERRMETINWLRDLRGYTAGNADAQQAYFDSVLARVPQGPLHREIVKFFQGRLETKTPVVWKLVGIDERAAGVYDLEWTETTEDTVGASHTTRWRGELESVIKPSRDGAVIEINELGFYVVRFVPQEVG
jgi:hypothetical protein